MHSLPRENDRIYKGLCKYSANTFVPAIVEMFEKTQSSNVEKCFSQAAIHRFNFLPEELKNLVYNRLCILHKAMGRAPIHMQVDSDYGKKAFHSESSGGPLERIIAIKECFSSVREAGSALKKRQREG